MARVCAFFLLTLLGTARAVRIESEITSEGSHLLAQPLSFSASNDTWITVHDIDLQESEKVHRSVHTEENCEDCILGDVLLPPGHSVSSFMEIHQNDSLGVGTAGVAWPGGTVYYKFKPNIHSKAKEVTLAAMRQWTHKTCIKFVDAEALAPCTPDQRDSRCFPVVMGSDKPGCNAHAGFYGAPWQSYNLAEACWTVGTALHELGHVLGLSHEHERANRDEFVEVMMQNIQPEMQRWFGVTSWRTASVTRELPYDLSSIMHYDSYAFALSHDFRDPSKASIRVKNPDTWGNCRIGQRTQLSAGDILTVGALYGCEDDFCADRSVNCPQFRFQGLCPGGGPGAETHRAWMEANCPATCGVCQCQDKHHGCQAWAMSGKCPGRASSESQRPEEAAWMTLNCAKSCGICGPTDLSCQDQPVVPEFGVPCGPYAANLMFTDGQVGCQVFAVQRACPRTCGACPAQIFC
mmetsp:Transcript_12008/g.26882  ORF Transcript_12008/g.26882 Transcript_12008/m.26882 type:complete len:464 (-) Transcript_12008:44-1435(-)